MSGQVPPSTRAGKRARSLQNGDPDVQAAASLRERFTGHKTRRAGVVEIPDLPPTVAVIGTLDFVGYTTVRDGRKEAYIHRFAARDKPLLCVSPDGEQIILVGGNYDFTERGIVDGSDRKTRREMGID